MKKAIAYLLLSLFLFNTAGYYFLFEIYKLKVRKEIEVSACRPGNSLRIIRIENVETDPGFKRIESNEIRYQGLLYDVIREEHAGETIIFYCIHDEKEERLLATMNAVSKNNFLLSLWQHMIKIAYPADNSAVMRSFAVEIIFPVLSFPLQPGSVDTFSPPPEHS